MKNLKKLHKDIYNAHVTGRSYLKDGILAEFLTKETNQCYVDFIKSISSGSCYGIAKIVQDYIIEFNKKMTISEIIEDGDMIMFDYNGVTYQYAGNESGRHLFKPLGKNHLVELDHGSEVDRLF